MKSRHLRTAAAVTTAALLLTFAAALPAGAASVPTVEVDASLDGPYAAATATIRELGTASTLTWSLRGPAAPVGGSCESIDWSTTPTRHSESRGVAGDGVVAIPSLHVGAPGCYAYAVTLWATPTTDAVPVTSNALLYSPGGPSNPVSYPIDRGIVTLSSRASSTAPASLLQETGERYYLHPEARNVVATPQYWGLIQQLWRLIQTGPDTYRFLNVDSGRALQATNDSTLLPLHDTRDPAYAVPRFNVVTTPASWNIAQQQIRVERVPGGDGSTVTLWGKVGSTEQRIEVTPIGYLNIPDVYLVGTGPGSVPWTVSGYTFPR